MTRPRTAIGKSSLALACLALGLPAIAGCNTTMEDGYKPHALGASPDIRRSYYASPFTEQAEPRAAQNTESGFRKPGM